MPDTKISALPAATAPLDPNGFVPVVIGATTRRALIKDLAGTSTSVFETATAPTAVAVGDIWLKPTGTAGSAALSIWNGTAWVASSDSSLPPPTDTGYLLANATDQSWSFAEPVIVSPTEPQPPTLAAQAAGVLWVDPDGEDAATSGLDVLAAIRGQVIAPRAIDLDGPHTLFITANPDGSAKLTLRVDGTPLRAVTEESVATEEWVLANSGGIHVGEAAPANNNILWLNPTGVGIAPPGEPPFVVSVTAPATTSSIWLNPQG